MNVSELIEYLEDCDPEAEVLIMEQPGWPFEYSVIGIATREDFEETAEDERDKKSNDVFLLEGKQLRYGTKDAWNRA
jgi:hypothetical protein